MQIAVYHNLPSGGAKRALHEMMRRLSASHDLSVYTLSTAEHNFCDLRSLCRQHVIFPFATLPPAPRPFGRLNQGSRVLDLLRLQALQKKVAQHIDSQGYDLIYAHVCRFGQSPSLLQYLNSPSVYYCQEPPRLLYEPAEDRPYTQLSRTQRIGNLFDPLPAIYRKELANLDRKNLSAASSVLVNSHFSRETIYRIYGVYATVSRLGVDTTFFRPLDTEKEQMVLSVGALTSKKGFDFLIRSLARIETSQRPTLVVVSNFSYYHERVYLECLAAQLSVNVMFFEGIPDQDLVRLYNRAMLTVYAPIMEPFGFVPLESMACGTPVVGVREAGVRETVCHDETGVLVERDFERFAAAIAALLDDQGKRKRLGHQARAYVESEWTWERSIEELELHLQRAVKAV